LTISLAINHLFLYGYFFAARLFPPIMGLPHFYRRVRNPCLGMKSPNFYFAFFALSYSSQCYISKESSVKNVCRCIPIAVIVSFFICAPFAVQAAENKVSHEVYLERANALIRSYQHFPAVIALQQAIRLADDKYPSIYMRLAILYYGLGMIPDAVAAGEKAVALSPQTKWYKFDLAKFYLVDKRYQQAKEQLLTLLQLDPGFTLGYVYLGEVYLALGHRNMAWTCLEWADKLGHDGDLLRQKLQIAGGRPSAEPETLAKGQPDSFRFIKVENRKDADAILKDIANGKSFENMEMELQNAKKIHADFGLITTQELDERVAAQLAAVKAFAPPVVVQTGSDYRVMQKILPFNRPAWARLETGAGAAAPVAAAIADSAGNASPPTKISVNNQAEVVSSISAMPTAAGARQAEAQPTLTAPKPAPSTASEQPVPAGDESSVAQAIEKWRNFWQSADVDRYLASYSPSFIPARGMSLNDWRASRVRNLTSPSMMEIVLSDIRITMRGANEATARFRQDYSSDRLRESVIKTLSLRLEDGRWKITKEAVERTR
jgi:tetratricopeptide (TPR) repeat protein